MRGCGSHTKNVHTRNAITLYMYVTIYIYAGLAHGRNKKMREAHNQSRAQFIFISKWGKENMPFMD